MVVAEKLGPPSRPPVFGEDVQPEPGPPALKRRDVSRGRSARAPGLEEQQAGSEVAIGDVQVKRIGERFHAANRSRKVGEIPDQQRNFGQQARTRRIRPARVFRPAASRRAECRTQPSSRFSFQN